MEWIDFERISCVRVQFTHLHLFSARTCATEEHMDIRGGMTRIQGTLSRFNENLDDARCRIGHRGRDTRARSIRIKNLFIISKRFC